VLRRQLIIQEEVLKEVECAEESGEVDLAVENRLAGGENFRGFGIQSWKQA